MATSTNQANQASSIKASKKSTAATIRSTRQVSLDPGSTRANVYKDTTTSQEEQPVKKDEKQKQHTDRQQEVQEQHREQQRQRQRQRQRQERETGHARQPQLTEKELEEYRRKQEEARKKEDKDIDVAGYKKLAKIGEGTYGEVFRGICKKSNKSVALKRIQLNISQSGVPTTAMREVALLKEINHSNVIQLQDLIYFDTIIYLVFNYCDIDLRRYMDKLGRDGLTFKHIKSFCHQLLQGLQYCHSHRILHRDLKPQNLLVDQSGKLTIADLGLSRAFGVPMRTYTHQVITLWYRAPEILLGSPHYSTAVDMWSVGCILAEMITMKPLFPGDSQIDELFRIFRVLGTPTEAVWPGVTTLPDFHATFPPWRPSDIKQELKKFPKYIEVNELAIDLLQSLLVYDPYSRISAQKAEEHPFFYDDITMLKF